jgi:uncharacterized membrane-anchored protein
VAEPLSVAYGRSIAIFGGIIALITIAQYAFRLNAVLAFRLADVKLPHQPKPPPATGA